MTYSIISRRTVPMTAARHAGEKAVCVKLDGVGFMAWGFSQSERLAETQAVERAEALRDAAARAAQ